MSVLFDGQHNRRSHPVYLGIVLDHTLSYKKHFWKTASKLKSRNNLLMKLAGSSWGTLMSWPYGRLPWLFAIEQKSMVTLCSHWYGWCPVERRYMQLISGTSSMVTSSYKHWTSSLEQEGCLSQTGGEVVVTYSWQLANSLWYPLPTTTVTVIQESTMARLLSNRDHKSVVERLEFGLGGQLPLSGWPHNLTTRFWPPSTTVVSPESL